MSSTATALRRGVTSFVIILPLVAMWSLATPLGAAFDENEHFLRAASIVRGQFRPPTVRTAVGLQSLVRVRTDLATVAVAAKCTAFHANVPASCESSPSSSHRLVVVVDAAGRYPPLYYLLVGWPTLFTHGREAMWSVRLLSVLLVTLLLAIAHAILRSEQDAMLGFAVALTPTCLFLGGIVNPSSVEIAAAFVVWVGMLHIAQDGPSRPVVWLTAAGAGALILTRPLGPLMLAGVLAAVALRMGVGRARVLVADMRMRPAATVVASALLVQAAWLLFAGPPHLTALGKHHGSTFAAMVSILKVEGVQVQSMVARFGWGETHAHGLTFLAWAAGSIILLVAFARRAHGMDAAQAVALVATIIAIQLTFDLINFRTLGFFWNGRYSLPLVVGVPLLMSRKTGPLSAASIGSARVALAIGHVTAFLWTLDRYAFGGLAERHLVWQPPGGVWLTSFGFIAAISIYFATASRSSHSDALIRPSKALLGP